MKNRQRLSGSNTKVDVARRNIIKYLSPPLIQEALFMTAYFIDKEGMWFYKFLSLYVLLSCKANLPEKFYYDHKTYSEMVFTISCDITINILDRVRDFLFSLMIDESTDVSLTWHLVVFVTFSRGFFVFNLFSWFIVHWRRSKWFYKYFWDLHNCDKNMGIRHNKVPWF